MKKYFRCFRICRLFLIGVRGVVLEMNESEGDMSTFLQVCGSIRWGGDGRQVRDVLVGAFIEVIGVSGFQGEGISVEEDGYAEWYWSGGGRRFQQVEVVVRCFKVGYFVFRGLVVWFVLVFEFLFFIKKLEFSIFLDWCNQWDNVENEVACLSFQYSIWYSVGFFLQSLRWLYLLLEVEGDGVWWLGRYWKYLGEGGRIRVW